MVISTLAMLQKWGFVEIKNCCLACAQRGTFHNQIYRPFSNFLETALPDRSVSFPIWQISWKLLLFDQKLLPSIQTDENTPRDLSHACVIIQRDLSHVCYIGTSHVR